MQSMKPGRLRRVAAGAVGAALLVLPASAQDHGEAMRQRDPWTSHERSLQHRGDPFELGYRAGREEERRRAAGRYDGGRRVPLGSAWNDAAQRETFERLEHAAFELRRALMLMQRMIGSDLAAERPMREALEQARQALIRTQNAMTWMPPEGAPGGPGYERRSGRGIGAQNASGGFES